MASPTRYFGYVVGGAAFAYLLSRVVPEIPALFGPIGPKGSEKLDAGLSDDDAVAAAFALAHDDSPDRLRTFGRSFLPDYPVTGSRLLTRASFLEKGGGPISRLPATPHPASTAALETALEATGHTIFPMSRSQPTAASRQTTMRGTTFGALSFLDIVDPLHILPEGVDELTESIWDEYSGDFAPTELKIFADMNTGKNFEDSLNVRVKEDTFRAAKAIKLAGPFLAMIPGIGTGANVALQAGAALALGEDVSDIAIDAAAGAIPGGPVVQESFKTAAHAANNVRRGAGADAIALSLAREALASAFQTEFPDADPFVVELIQVAYDAGVALGQAQSLQTLGFRSAYRLLGALPKGDEVHIPLGAIGERINSFDNAVRVAQNTLTTSRTWLDATDYLVENFMARLPPEYHQEKLGRYVGTTKLGEDLKPIVSAMVEHPWHGSGEVSDLQNLIPCYVSPDCRPIDERLLQIAMATVEDVPGGLVINKRLAAKLFPYSPREIPPAALSRARQMYRTAKDVALLPGRGNVSPASLDMRGGGAFGPMARSLEDQRALSQVSRDAWTRAYMAAARGEISVDTVESYVAREA